MVTKEEQIAYLATMHKLASIKEYMTVLGGLYPDLVSDGCPSCGYSGYTAGFLYTDAIIMLVDKLQSSIKLPE